MLPTLSVMVLTWLGFQPKQAEKVDESTRESSYLITGGAEIHAQSGVGEKPLTLSSGSLLALAGHDTYRKHYFCDWILGFVDIPGSRVRIQVGSQTIESAKSRTQTAALLGRSPLLYGETIREALLYRTSDVRKADLYQLIERLYGPSLKARTMPTNPLFALDGKPVPTQVLTAREHMEVAQINLILQKPPIVVLDLSSELMAEAMEEGFRPSSELLDSGKTILAILPPNRDVAWAESVLGRKFSSTMKFEA